LPTDTAKACALPLYAVGVSAGFPSPADDYVECSLDLNDLLIKRPAATFFVRAQGDSMLGCGIHSGDMLVVDRAIEATSGKVVICALNGELTVKRLVRKIDHWVLQAENPDYAEIKLIDELDAIVWGVVTNVIHAL
jgi:DNA polymerase V